MNQFKDRLNKITRRYRTFFKWLALATIVGIVVGGIGTLFHYTIAEATALRQSHPWLVFLLPAFRSRL